MEVLFTVIVLILFCLSLPAQADDKMLKGMLDMADRSSVVDSSQPNAKPGMPKRTVGGGSRVK